MVGISGDVAATILHPGFIKGWGKTAGCDMGNNKNTTQKEVIMMKHKIAVMMVALVAIAVLVSNVGELKAQVPGQLSPELMEFVSEWGVLYSMAPVIPALLDYNDMLYEGKKVTVNECVEFDKAIGTIASVMKKAWAGIKDATIKKEMQLLADDYINASKLYADYHKTGKEEFKNKADELLESADKHWDNVNKYIEDKIGGEK